MCHIAWPLLIEKRDFSGTEKRNGANRVLGWKTLKASQGVSHPIPNP
jgi:hypothetical protein